MHATYPDKETNGGVSEGWQGKEDGTNINGAEKHENGADRLEVRSMDPLSSSRHSHLANSTQPNRNHNVKGNTMADAKITSEEPPSILESMGGMSHSSNRSPPLPPDSVSSTGDADADTVADADVARRQLSAGHICKRWMMRTMTKEDSPAALSVGMDGQLSLNENASDSDESLALTWRPKDRRHESIDCILPLRSIRDVFKGAQSDALRLAVALAEKHDTVTDSTLTQSPSVSSSISAAPASSTTLVLQSSDESLSLQFDSMHSRDTVCSAVCKLLESTYGKVRIVDDESNLLPPITLTESEKERVRRASKEAQPEQLIGVLVNGRGLRRRRSCSGGRHVSFGPDLSLASLPPPQPVQPIIDTDSAVDATHPSSKHDLNPKLNSAQSPQPDAATSSSHPTATGTKIADEAPSSPVFEIQMVIPQSGAKAKAGGKSEKQAKTAAPTHAHVHEPTSSATSSPSVSSSDSSLQGMKPSKVEKLVTEKAQLIHAIQLSVREMVHSSSDLLRSKYVDAEGQLLPQAQLMEFEETIKKHSKQFSYARPFAAEDFESKSYAPTIFSRLRSMVGLDDLTFLNSVADEERGFNDLIVNSKSGAYFFFTHDRRHIIKSMTHAELIVLLRHLLPRYLSYLESQPDSLLIRILGCFRLHMKIIGRRKTHQSYFIIMRNVFKSPPDRPIHVRYDLKGSTYGRVAREVEKAQPVPVLKDVDFFEGCKFPDGRTLPPFFLHLGEKRDRLVKQLANDAAFLRSCNIIDYSLLLGVHDTAREKQIQLQHLQQQQKQKHARAASTGTLPSAATSTHPSQQLPATTVSSAPSTITKRTPSISSSISITPPPSLPTLHTPAPASASTTSDEEKKAAEEEADEDEDEDEQQQTNYGSRPQKEVVIPRGLIRRATMLMLGDDRKESAKGGVAQRQVSDEEAHRSAPPVLLSATSTPSLQPPSSATSSSSSSSTAHVQTPPFPPSRLVAISSSSSRADSLFDADGCLMSRPCDDSQHRCYYYLGIIDILQQYTGAKQVEHTFKAMLFSSVNYTQQRSRGRLLDGWHCEGQCLGMVW